MVELLSLVLYRDKGKIFWYLKRFDLLKGKFSLRLFPFFISLANIDPTEKFFD
jgi:hypothetical protein